MVPVLHLQHHIVHLLPLPQQRHRLPLHCLSPLYRLLLPLLLLRLLLPLTPRRCSSCGRVQLDLMLLFEVTLSWMLGHLLLLLLQDLVCHIPKRPLPLCCSSLLVLLLLLNGRLSGGHGLAEGHGLLPDLLAWPLPMSG